MSSMPSDIERNIDAFNGQIVNSNWHSLNSLRTTKRMPSVMEIELESPDRSTRRSVSFLGLLVNDQRMYLPGT